METDGEMHFLTVRSDASAEVREIWVDGVVAGIGIDPNVELARKAGLKEDDGIAVDERLRTSDPDIFAAGDAASFHNPALGKRIRVEHEDNAKTMGLMAGRAMAGDDVTYHHLPFFYSDLFELGYEAVGETSALHETVADWKEPFREGVVYYLEGGPRAGRPPVERVGAGRRGAAPDRRSGAVPGGRPQGAPAEGGLKAINRFLCRMTEGSCRPTTA